MTVPPPAARLAPGLLLLTAAIWGFAFVAQRLGMQHMGPLLFNGIRFVLGAGTLALVLAWRQRPAVPAAGRRTAATVRALWPGGALAGVLLFGGATLQQWGLVYTSAGKAGFITGLYVVFVPVLGRLLGQRLRAMAWAGAALAAAGLYLLSVGEALTLAPGDGLVLASAVCWAAHVLLVDRLVRRLDWAWLAFTQFAICAGLSLAAALALEPVTLTAVAAAAAPLLYGGVLSVGMGYTLQVAAQRHTPPAAAAIILSLEAVFAALGGWLLLAEALAPRELAGCGLMLAAILVSQVTPAPPVPLNPSRAASPERSTSG